MGTNLYAPVIIPTLNRFEHFRRCLESLEHCSGADKTEVFVGLDYPPSEEYIAGWRKINEYLREKEFNNGFARLVIERRETNYGICKLDGNFETLVRDISNNYDSYIFTEDDNEFSPCFLEYMNQNLEKYKDDESVFRICGYLPPKHNFPSGYSQFKANRHVAWGVGCWTSKSALFYELEQPRNLHILFENKHVIKELEKDNLESILISLIKMSKGAPILEDVIVAAYLIYSNCRCILPTKSMVRNLGCDGTGQHSALLPEYNNQKIQGSNDYFLTEAPLEFTESFEADMHKSRIKSHRNPMDWMLFVSWKLYKYTGVFCEFKNIQYFIKKIKKALQFLKRLL